MAIAWQVTTLLTTVDEPGPVEAYIYVPADRARNLRVGVPVHLVDTAGKDLADSKITFISPQVDTDTQTVLAKATVENSRATLRISQQVRAQLIWGTHEGTVIPILAVTRINGEFFAFLSEKENGKTVARQKLLHVGDTVGNDYAVQDGIKAGRSHHRVGIAVFARWRAGDGDGCGWTAGAGDGRGAGQVAAQDRAG